MCTKYCVVLKSVIDFEVMTVIINTEKITVLRNNKYFK